MFNRTDIEQVFFNQRADHMTMCEFATADDPCYKNILRVLQEYLQNITQGRSKRQQDEQNGKRDVATDR